MTTYLNFINQDIIDRKDNLVKNHWIWLILVVVIVALLAYYAYAIYCTSRGYQFHGVSFGWLMAEVSCKK